MATKIVTNMKDFNNAVLEIGRQKIKAEIDKFVNEWKNHYIHYQANPVYGSIEKTIDMNVNLVGTSTIEIAFEVIDDVYNFAQKFSIQENAESREIYETFKNDFELFCKEHKLPIKRV
jgi:hypothetical protein